MTKIVCNAVRCISNENNTCVKEEITIKREPQQRVAVCKGFRLSGKKGLSQGLLGRVR